MNRLQPQIDPSVPQDQIGASEENAAMVYRHANSPPAVLEDNDMLEEILLRLPPQLSSLPRVSAVCKRWRGLVADPRFLCCFYAHHRNPPLLGVFFQHGDKINFTSALPAPDRIPDGRLNLPFGDLSGRLLGCRHGLVLILHQLCMEVLVCDPIAGNQHCVPIPPKFKCGYVHGAVLCAARDRGHVHGGCHSTLFKVVLMLTRTTHGRPLASVYSSETYTWADLISTEVEYRDCFGSYINTLVGNVLYWSFKYVKEGILAFDLERHSFYVLEGPPGMSHSYSRQIIQTEDGAIGLAMISRPDHNIEMWQRKTNCLGVATWVLWKTIETDNILGLPPRVEGGLVRLKFILGYIEDTDGIFLCAKDGVYMVQLNSMQSRKLCGNRDISYRHSFKSFYAPGGRETSL